MQPRFETTPEKKLIGHCSTMTLSNDQTPTLFRTFMPLIYKINQGLRSDVYAVTKYTNGDINRFTASTPFEKWAAVEFQEQLAYPDSFQVIHIPSGLYAVFTLKGTIAMNANAIKDIFSQWLPASNYTTDDRPHFALMGEKYKNNDPESEEEFWVPIKVKM